MVIVRQFGSFYCVSNNVGTSNLEGHLEGRSKPSWESSWFITYKSSEKGTAPLKVIKWGGEHATQAILHSSPFMAQIGHSLSSMTHFYSACQFGSLLQRHTAGYSEIPTTTFQKTTQIKRCMLWFNSQYFLFLSKHASSNLIFPLSYFFGEVHNFALHFKDKCACTCLHTFTHSARPQSVLSCTSEYAVANSKHVKYSSLKYRFLCTL